MDCARKGCRRRLNGKASGKTYKAANGQYVELAREGEDSILTVLGEFTNVSNPLYGGLPGPLHNQIPQPNRAVDNTTIWAPNFNQAYYQNLLFSEAPGASSMRNFYIEQSSGRYTVNGGVTNWGTGDQQRGALRQQRLRQHRLLHGLALRE